MLSTLTRLLKALLFAAAVSAVFYFVGGFSTMQSILLALVILLVYSDLHRRFPQRITPFNVVVKPHWALLLKDTGLADEEKWKAIKPSVPERPEAYNVLHSGVSFTVLELNLIYLNHHHVFIS